MGPTLVELGLLAITFSAALVLYALVNDRKLANTPNVALSLSKRLTHQDMRELAGEMESHPLAKETELKEQMPPKTGRRYIVTGGSGFLGGYVVAQLLDRGEDPRKIRILDLNEPSHPTVSSALSQGLQLFKTNLADSKAVLNAFTAPWYDDNKGNTSTTVFHTASNILFYERHPAFLDRSTKVNVEGTRNVVSSSKAVNADVLIYTSSAAAGVKSTRLLLFPWETHPKHHIQVFNEDSESHFPKEHWGHFSNYAISKRMAEALVLEADKSNTSGGKTLRTGALRPHGIFGRGDVLLGACIVREISPTWMGSALQSFCYVENCALAHLLYERRLLDLLDQDQLSKPTLNSQKRPLPDIGGRPFCISDPCPTPTHNDTYVAMETFTHGVCSFPYLPTSIMLIVAHLIEAYYVTQHFITTAYPILRNLFPPVVGDVRNLQPAIFYLTKVHIIVDDSRARLSPEKGGLGYKGAWTTMEGIYKMVQEYKSESAWSDARNGRVGMNYFGLGKKARKDMAADGFKSIPIPALPVEVITGNAR
ncbi:NAD(P)-binding protein [Coprinopsis marcescibilis]|uniref:NAD(P)-binding protein n=1 Tax=Coprinopsis marcescibilis TaxID=230819 RepID=A0A5C3L964_COPMA|nr:NAD(P)-binding protein [Coprinopsis marcescibilis]